MRVFALFSMLVVLLLCASCAAPPTCHRVAVDTTLTRPEGVFLMADVCIQKDAVGDSDDYFMISESKLGAEAALRELSSYLANSGIKIRSSLVPFVCGARQNTPNGLLRAANKENDPIQDLPQPLAVAATLQDDPEYVRALTVISTYAIERAATDRPPNKNNEAIEPPQNATRPQIDDNEFKSAASLLKKRTQASSVLYLGILGTSRTTGKAALQSTGSFLVGMTVGLATAGLGTGYALAFTPGHQIDGRVMEGAMLDLDSGDITWSNAVHAGGDPIKPETVADAKALDLLFHGVVFKASPNNNK